MQFGLFSNSPAGTGAMLAFGSTAEHCRAQMVVAGFEDDGWETCLVTDALAESSGKSPWCWLPGTDDTIACLRAEAEEALAEGVPGFYGDPLHEDADYNADEDPFQGEDLLVSEAGIQYAKELTLYHFSDGVKFLLWREWRDQIRMLAKAFTEADLSVWTPEASAELISFVRYRLAIQESAKDSGCQDCLDEADTKLVQWGIQQAMCWLDTDVLKDLTKDALPGWWSCPLTLQKAI